MRGNTLRLFVASLLLLSATAAFAGGPLIIFNPAAQQPWAYGPGVNFYTDRGPLSTVGAQVLNADARNLVVASIAEWTGVPTASFTGAWITGFAGIGLPNIDQTNAGLVIGPDNAEPNAVHVIYDTNGLVLQNFLGAPPGVLGVASPEYGVAGTLTESWMVLNGTTVDPADTPLGLNFGGVVTHETGHAINMAHTQTNGARIFFGDNPGPGSCPRPYPGFPLGSHIETMYPFIDVSASSGIGVEFATIDHPDETTTLSDIYPAAGYPNSFGTIEGTIFTTNGTTPLGGVNVIARNVANPFADAVSALSGDFTQAPNDGRYRFTGLTPGADYIVYVDEIVAGGFSTAPVPLPGPEEYWNLNESENPLTDPPCDFDAINVAMNQTVTADIKLNAAAPPATIAVAPTSFVFNVPLNGTDSANLSISNTAAAGSDDLTWTLQDNVPPGPAPIEGSSSVSRVEVRLGEGSVLRPGAWAARDRVNPDATDPRLQRGWGQGKASGSTPVDPPVVHPNAIVADGGFEAGTPNPSWTEFSTNFGTPICDAATCGTGGGTGPNNGLFWCWFGGIAAVEVGSVSQSVVFPAGPALNLEFFLEIPACDSASDFMEVLIDGTQVFFANGADASCGMSGYQQIVVDVSAFADGLSHTLEFRSEVFGNNAGVTNFFVDDIDLVVPLADCPWLSASPVAGTVPPGNSQNVTVSVDATGLAAGTYDCELRIESNAANDPLVIVPVTLNVSGAQPEVNALVSTAANGPVSWFSRPDGGGVPLTAAYLWDMVPGNPPIQVDATISVTLADELGNPIANYPAGNIGVQAASGGWVQCPGSEITADADTDANGTTTISGVLFASGAGGMGELLQVTIDDPNLNTIIYAGGGAGLDIRVNSVDIVDFGVTNLVDLGEFANDFNTAYAYRSDFVWDGALNLADVGAYASGNGSACPAVPKIAVTGAGDAIGIGFDPTGRQTAITLEPGASVEAYLVLRGPSVAEGISAWAARLETSSNVEIVSVTLPEGALNVGEGRDYVVGTGATLRAAEDQPLRLATIRLRALDDRPAHLSVRPSELGAAIAVAGEQRGLQSASGSFDVPVAYLNDASAPEVGVAFEGYQLRNSPNPFNPATEIRFSLPHAGQAEIRIFDVSGRLVTTLDGGQLAAGANALTWRGTDHRGAPVVSGIYYYKLFLDGADTGGAVKMSLLK